MKILLNFFIGEQMSKSLLTFIPLLIIINLNSQSLDPSFLDSLPSDIRSDLLESISQAPENAPESTKEYDAFNSRIDNKKNNKVPLEGSLKKFGSNFFNNTPSTFMPINDPSANSGYILDVDDEVLIQLIGDRAGQYSYKINRSGNIALSDIGMINVAGLSLNDANKIINEVLKDNFVETQAIISLEKVRDIEILVTGQVENPGVYILNGYSSLLHALIMAGGVSEYGSMRNVVIKRPRSDDKVIDLYDMFVFGNTESNISLRSGDSIFIKSSKNFVPVIGGVVNPAIYEFKEGEDSDHLINFAGGRLLNSDSKNIIITRFNNGDLSSAEIKNPIRLQKNDRIFIPFNDFNPDLFAINKKDYFVNDPVRITGAVMNPGDYFVEPGDSMLDLLLKSGGYKDNSFPKGGILINEKAALLETTYNEKLYNEAIKSLATLSSISKSVDITSLLSLLSEFKNIQTSGRVVAEFELEKIQNNPLLDTRLYPGDTIFIPYLQNRIYIFGEVLNPGTLKFNKSYDLSDYIKNAGGLNKYADKRSIIIVGPDGSVTRETSRQFGSNINDLIPGTVIYVPRDLNFIEGTELAKIIAPIFSSLALSLASLNSISNN